MASLFAAVDMAPRDPILGLNDQFNADPNPAKVNLGVGVYTDENGKLPLLKCVAEAERQMQQAAKPRGYLPIDGIAAYDKAVQALLFGADSSALAECRVATVQGLGGTGGLKIGADFLHRLNPEAQVLISDPSWENHRALFTNAGFAVGTYPYYDAAKLGIDFQGLLATLDSAAAGTIVVLHACCHNPTGYDLSPAQWDEVVRVVKARGLVAFLDMAYQGFGDGLREDGAAVQQFGRRGARAEPAEDRDPHQLLEPAHPWRPDRRDGSDHAGAARPVGRRAGRHAGADQADAQPAAGQAAGCRSDAGHVLHHPAEGNVQLLRPDQGPDAAPAQ